MAPSVNSRIITALSPLGYPVVQSLYTGSKPIYLTFNYSAHGDVFADDAPGYEVYMIQVHLLAPYGWNSVGVRRRIKRLLFDAGFTWPEETDAGSGARTDDHARQHIVFECQIEEGVEDG